MDTSAGKVMAKRVKITSKPFHYLSSVMVSICM